MATCVINLSSILPSCEAFQSVAGVRDFSYFCRRIDITAITQATDGTVTAFTVGTGKLKKFQTQKFQNSGAFGLQSSDIGKTRFTQTFISRVYYRDQASRNAMEQMILAEDIVWFSPNNDNQIEIYGLSLGLKATTVAGGTGTKLEDDNTALLTFTGIEPKLPAVFNSVTTPTTETADFQTNIALLDTKVGA